MPLFNRAKSLAASVCAVVVSVLVPSAFAAVIPMSTLSAGPSNLTYTNDFNALASVTSVTAWADDSTFANWVAINSPVGNTLNINQSTGGSSTGSLYNYGSTGSSDRAFGTLPSDSLLASGSGFLFHGVRFVNDTSDVYKFATVNYTGEQWRVGAVTNATNNQLVVASRTFTAGAGSLTSTGFTSFPGATFNTPNDGGGSTSATLDGNNAANRVANLTGTLELGIAPGQEVWIRFADTNSSGADHGIAVDDLTVTFTVPEPASLGAIACIAFTGLTRRRAAAAN